MRGQVACPNLHTSKEAPGAMLGVYLETVRQNPSNDELLECLACGYQAVYRMATDTFEAPPWWTARWQSPVDPNNRAQAAQEKKDFGAPQVSEFDLMPSNQAPQIAPAPMGTGESLTPVDVTTALAEPIAMAPVAVETAAPVAAPAKATEYVTIKDAATILGVKPSDLLKRVTAGEVPSVKKGQIVMIPQSWVDES